MRQLTLWKRRKRTHHLNEYQELDNLEQDYRETDYHRQPRCVSRFKCCRSNVLFSNIVTLYISFLFVLCISYHCVQAMKDELIVSTESGRVRGIRYYFPKLEKAVDSFLGIPFAKAPVGIHRFKHPQPIDRWTGIFNATKLPNSCYQLPDDYFGKEFYGSNMWNSPTRVSEDCLYLNIWVPKTQPRVKKSAVMIWIYGGGFYSGTTTLDLYDGRILAVENNVIVVSVGYRVGVFGFLYLGHPASPGNAGMFDQLMALEWVQKNIRQFGGDPDNVTLFGESAGASSVSLHLLSPLSANNFQRAIMQSGTANMPWATLSQAEAKQRGLVLAHDAIECPPSENMEDVIDCLRNVPAHTLATKQFMVSYGAMQFPFAPVIDGSFLTDSPQSLINRREFKKCPIIIGSNLNEGSFFMIYELGDYMSLDRLTMTRQEFDRSITMLFPFYPQYQKAITPIALDAIKYQYTNWADPDDILANVNALDRALGDSQFVCPLNDFALAYANAGLEVYMYYLTQRYNGNPWPSWMGVLHGDDVFYVFGETLKHDVKSTGLNFTKEDRDLSKRVMHYWTNFAKTGNPNVIPGERVLDDWPLHRPHTREYLELNARVLNHPDKSKAIGRGPKIKDCAFWNRYLPNLVSSTDFMGHHRPPVLPPISGCSMSSASTLTYNQSTLTICCLVFLAIHIISSSLGLSQRLTTKKLLGLKVFEPTISFNPQRPFIKGKAALPTV